MKRPRLPQAALLRETPDTPIPGLLPPPERRKAELWVFVPNAEAAGGFETRIFSSYSPGALDKIREAALRAGWRVEEMGTASV